jgi:hypothetical protein
VGKPGEVGCPAARRRVQGIERALVLADVAALSALLRAEPAAAVVEIDGSAPLLVLLRRSTGSAADVRSCARLLLDAGEGQTTALFHAVERAYLELVRLLLDHGATRDDDASTRLRAVEHRLAGSGQDE